MSCPARRTAARLPGPETATAFSARCNPDSGFSRSPWLSACPSSSLASSSPSEEPEFSFSESEREGGEGGGGGGGVGGMGVKGGIGVIGVMGVIGVIGVMMGIPYNP